MKHNVKQLKSLAIALKELEPHIRNGRALQVGREFKSIKQRPRELLANWLLCAVACATRGKETVKICQDPLGGDGMLVDAETNDLMLTEHVYIPPQEGEDIGALIEHAVGHKSKKGDVYTRGRTLVIMLDATGTWYATAVARKIAGKHGFKGVWVASLDGHAIASGRYVYFLSELDASGGQAPTFRVELNEDFTSWQVSQIQ